MKALHNLPEGPFRDGLASLALQITRKAVADYRSAEAAYREASRRSREIDELLPPSKPGERDRFVMTRPLDAWTDLASFALGEAERHLIRCILAQGNEYRLGGFREAEIIAFPPTAIVLDGVCFVAYLDPGVDLEIGQKHEDESAVMLLLELPADALCCVGQQVGIRS